MDFLDPRKRRTHSIRLFVGYALVGLALLIATGLIALYTYGFDLNRKTGTIIQNGLVFVDAAPESTDIYLNGESKGKTSSRLVIAEGQYSIELRRNGYRTWKKQFSLEGSEIQRLVYPLLFPEKLVSKELQLYSNNPRVATISPDRKWLLVQKPGSLTEFEVYDLTTTTNSPVTLTLPASLVTAADGTHTMELSEWSNDNRRVVIKHNYSGGVEYLLVDREAPNESQNLTKFFVRPNVQVTLRDKKYDQYYLHDQSTLSLSTAELKSSTVTPLLEKVLAFKPHSADIILFSTESTTEGKELLKLKSGTDIYTLREITKGDVQLLDIARFDNHWYVAGGSNAEGKVYVFRDPVNVLKRKDGTPATPVAALKQDNPRFVSFSANARFLAVQSGGMFTVYDAEEVKQSRYDTKLAMPATYRATWMDGHRLSAVVDGIVRVFDFDGTNQQTLVKADPNVLPFFDKEYKALFTISPSTAVAGKTALVRTELRVQN
jgi:hypothetical protein